MKTFIWIIQPIEEITMVAVNANSEEQARQIIKDQIERDSEELDTEWVESFFEEIEKNPYHVLGLFESITFGNWNI